MTTETLCLLAVHAHPDDEASKGAGTIARYHAEGVRTVLVTATGGEEGEILNPALDTDAVRKDLPEIRRRELEEAANAIGYDELVLLGYRDSGMPESAANADPRSFWQAPIDEATGRLVAAIRTYRPQVVVTYPDEQNFYPHPDHLRVHDISLLALDRVGDAGAYPEAGAPYQPLKLYYTVWQLEQILLRHEKFLEFGLESPYAEWFKDGVPEDFPDRAPTTLIDVSSFYDARRAGLMAHATQIDPSSPFWFGLPEQVEREVFRTDGYVLARNLVGPIEPEDDLFAGVRERVGAAAK
ncbi:MAG: mycothiol conjugate amidase Mca [Acidimicrobiales bacterium]